MMRAPSLPFALTRCRLGGAALLLLLTACGGGSDTAVAARTLVMSTGSLQCEPSRSTDARRLAVAAMLQAQGVTIERSACATDPRPRITLCGVANGDLFLLVVRGAHAPTETALGLQPADTVPGVQEAPCSPGS
jgi:hypothetical protein